MTGFHGCPVHPVPEVLPSRYELRWGTHAQQYDELLDACDAVKLRGVAAEIWRITDQRLLWSLTPVEYRIRFLED